MHTDDDDGDEMSSPREETSTVDDLAKAAGVESTQDGPGIHKRRRLRRRWRSAYTPSVNAIWRWERLKGMVIKYVGGWNNFGYGFTYPCQKNLRITI